MQAALLPYAEPFKCRDRGTDQRGRTIVAAMSATRNERCRNAMMRQRQRCDDAGRPAADDGCSRREMLRILLQWASACGQKSGLFATGI
jgi:hypothetical protein